ncbi:hypothetical protein C8R43DRAFT_1124722 [Mycena crocata]|nr:hypothetical protein C8R43DRAFT_1124722 [Mycena crocata]
MLGSTAEEMAPRVPVLPQSRPVANIPKPAPAGKVKKAKPEGKGGRRKHEVSAAAAKTAAKTGGRKAAGRRRRTAAAEEEEEAGDDAAGPAAPDDAVLADASNTLIYTTTNNTIKFDRELKARQAATKAAAAPKSDLVIVPAPARPRRERHPTTNPDNTTVALPVRRTLAQMREANLSKTENALLARTGRLAVATSSTGVGKKRGSGKK